jgi:hypothetical protein
MAQAIVQHSDEDTQGILGLEHTWTSFSIRLECASRYLEWGFGSSVAH